jgi:hypothetical protein
MSTMGFTNESEMPKKDWRVIAKQKQEERDSRLPSKWRIKDLPSDDILDVTQLFVERKWLNEEELAITGLTAVQLAKAIKERQYTSVAVVEAYAHRATIAQQLVHPYVPLRRYLLISVLPRSTSKKRSKKLSDWMIILRTLGKWSDRCMGPLSRSRYILFFNYKLIAGPIPCERPRHHYGILRLGRSNRRKGLAHRELS